MSQNYEYFGKYILLEKLATGGMAEVWLARAPGAGGIGKFVAIKKILPQYSDNPEFIQMFKDEAAIALNLSHSNIVSIYEFGQERQTLFLVMDYVEGRNLRQLLNRMKQGSQKFSTDQIVYMIKEVAAGLDHAHRSLSSATGNPLNITHRDMSPQNIMITFEGEVKIVDFGIAKAESQMENTRTGTLKGKFGYMSPEQAEGHSTDLRTDVFSLGIVLWELLANDRLFIANNEINTLKKIRECNIPSLTKLNPNIHPELERIVMKALTRDRNLRYQTAAAIHRDLSRFVNRQFPDFSPHDFSVFIKTLYTDEILDSRKRLIEYAKIPFKAIGGKAGDDDKTLVTSFPQSSDLKNNPIAPSKIKTVKSHSDSDAPHTQSPDVTLTATETFSDVQSNLNDSNRSASGISADRENSLSVNIEQKTQTESKVKLTGSENLLVLDQSKLQGSLRKKIVVTPKVPQALDDSNNGDESLLALNRINDLSKPDMSRKAHLPTARAGDNASPIINLVIFVAFMIITYVVVSSYFPKQTSTMESAVRKIFMQHSASKSPDPIAPVPAQKSNYPEPPSLADKPEVSPADFQTTTPIVVNSAPSGAEIYINGLHTGKTTPSRVDIPADKPFSMTLKLDGYYDYSKTKVNASTIGRTFTATLQRAMVAYIDIDIRPPSNNSRIYVNDQLIRDHILPISHYAIPANVPVIVRAENVLTKESAQEILTLREDQRNTVIFKFNNSRNPSSRKNK